mgnify:CR=1 FL=1|jgi:hypothetical protein
MTSRLLERHPLAIFLSITAVGLAAWLGVQVFLWLFLKVFNVNTSLWAMIEALSTAVAAAAVVGGAFVATRELSELANVRHMDVADKLFDELNSPENIAARRWVFQNLPDDPTEGLRTLTPEGRAYIKRVLNSLDRVAFLTQSNWIPEDMVMPWMNPMIVKAWTKLGPYVEFESRRRNEPEYYQMARRLAEHCVAWRKKHVQVSDITWLSDAL